MPAAHRMAIAGHTNRPHIHRGYNLTCSIRQVAHREASIADFMGPTPSNAALNLRGGQTWHGARTDRTVNKDVRERMG